MSRPAKVHDEIEVRSKMNQIGNILVHNHQQYLTVRTSWVAPNRWICLGTAAFPHCAHGRSSGVCISHRQFGGGASKSAATGRVNVLRVCWCYVAQCPCQLHLSFSPMCWSSAVFRLQSCPISTSGHMRPLPITCVNPGAPLIAPIRAILNKGHTALAFSFLSKLSVRQFAEPCDVDHVESWNSPAMATSKAWSLTCPIRPSPPVMTIIGNGD